MERPGSIPKIACRSCSKASTSPASPADHRPRQPKRRDPAFRPGHRPRGNLAQAVPAAPCGLPGGNRKGSPWDVSPSIPKPSPCTFGRAGLEHGRQAPCAAGREAGRGLSTAPSVNRDCYGRDGNPENTCYGRLLPSRQCQVES